uniref:Uncharacterized protein n=1 Tax=Manihot esculenta TaxID=3983 RepID=A0A2C9W8G9_MANES
MFLNYDPELGVSVKPKPSACFISPRFPHCYLIAPRDRPSALKLHSTGRLQLTARHSGFKLASALRLRSVHLPWLLLICD